MDLAERIAAVLEEARYCVYFLADPRTPRWPRYVGMTSDAAARARQHALRLHSSERMAAWDRELRAAGVKPLLVVHSTYPTNEAARAAEWRLIRRWKRRGLADRNESREGRAPSMQLMFDAINAREAEREAIRNHARGAARRTCYMRYMRECV